MKIRHVVAGIVLTVLTAAPVLALNPGNEHFVVAAVRGEGLNGSFYVTDLYAFNPNNFAVDVEIYWLWRDQANASSVPVQVTIPAATSVTVKDIIKEVFLQDSAQGGFRIVGLNGIVAGSVYIYDMHGPYGHTIEAVPVEGALYAGAGEVRASTLPLTQIFGIEQNEDWRTNFLGLGIDAMGSTFDLKVFDETGSEIAAITGISLQPWEPKLWPLADLGISGLDGGYLQITVTSGAAIFSAAKTSNDTNDSQTLEQWVLLGD